MEPNLSRRELLATAGSASFGVLASCSSSSSSAGSSLTTTSATSNADPSSTTATSRSSAVLNDALKDTVMVPGHMEQVTMDLLADNPGDWLFHCHNIYHLDGGMARVIEYAD